VFRSLRAAIGLVLLGMVLSACRTDAKISLRSDKAGAGLVAVDLSLDRDATIGLGAGESRLLTKDLSAGGWAVGGVVPADSGGSTIHAEKPFSNVQEANAILRELTGPTGPLSSVKLVRKKTIAGVELELSGTVDLSKGLGSFGDDQLKALTGSSSKLGIDDAEVARQAGTDLKSAFHFVLSAELLEMSNRWDVALGEQKPVSLKASRFAYETLVGLAAVVVAFIGLVLLLASRRRSSHHSGSGEL
jgi:hypothetical protein